MKNKHKTDPIVETVREKFHSRSERGVKKYGTTMAENPCSHYEWLNHLQEELMDATLYVEKLKRETSDGWVPVDEALPEYKYNANGEGFSFVLILHEDYEDAFEVMYCNGFFYNPLMTDLKLEKDEDMKPAIDTFHRGTTHWKHKPANPYFKKK